MPLVLVFRIAFPHSIIMSKRVVVLPGDGIGPEVMYPAIEAIEAVTDEIEFESHLFGGASIDVHGEPLTDETLEACLEADAVLLGAVGGPKWDPVDSLENDSPRPEQGLLRLRKAMNVYANLRPVYASPHLYDKSPLKNKRVAGTEFTIVRELTSGIYYGKKELVGDTASDECVYTRAEIEQVAHVAFTLAKLKAGKVTSVDKANVLETSRLWRQVVGEVGKNYDIELEHMLADTAFAKLIDNPKHFDVILTDNLFGDLLSDAAAPIAGSLGLMPSMSLGQRGEKESILCEPIHGSAPDIAGQNKANPIGMIWAAGWMLHQLKLDDVGFKLEKATKQTIADGVWTPDLDGKATTEMVADSILANLKQV